MKTKLKSIIALGLMVMCMSSCVYSLFPIWTKETLVYFPELEGKWRYGDGPEDFLLFEPGFDIDETIKVRRDEKNETEPEVTTNFNISIDEDSYIVEKGDTIRDREKIKAFYENEMKGQLEELGTKMGEAMGAIADVLDDIVQPSRKLRYDTEDQSYTMTAIDDGVERKYQVHLARIGEDIFMDLFAGESDMANQAIESLVWFPVHMFMKLELDGDEMILTQFDLEKMNKLFDSNLIRMDHENVDGSILITAKSEELQKFLDKYSNDESVFDNSETYRRVSQ